MANSHLNHPELSLEVTTEMDEAEECLISRVPRSLGTKTLSEISFDYIGSIVDTSGDMNNDDILRVMFLSCILCFLVGAYWLLSSLKDPILSAITGVEYIPQAKMATLVTVLALVIAYNKMLDVFPKHQVFYMLGGAFGTTFGVLGILLMHPTIGLPNTKSSPYRLLGWASYCAIESFGSLVAQCFWALVNSSVDVNFGKKYFGIIIAGAQIGSILGPTVATQAASIGVPALYMSGAVISFLMVVGMHFYICRFGPPQDEKEKVKQSDSNSIASSTEEATPLKKKKNEGLMESFYLFYEHDYVKGIFALSSFFMVQVTVIDYMMKVLAKRRYAMLYPNDPQLALEAFASFMGHFGQTTNSISFFFSLFGTGTIIQKCGFSNTLLAFPILLLCCTMCVWVAPTLWVVFSVMMVIKGMNYALNNPTKEILYQRTSPSIRYKCKSWIDTFGQRGAKATGSLITNQFASNIMLLNDFGTAIGVVMSLFLIWVSEFMGRKFDEVELSQEKIGEEK